MSKQGRLTDPVEGKVQEAGLAQEMESLDISKLNPVAIPLTAARPSRPFDGYPVKKTFIGEGKDKVQVCLTHIVIHNHIAFPVAQDASGPKVKNKRVQTYHNRWIRDVDNGGVGNVAVHFDRPIKTAQGEFYASIVPDPYVRCQLCFQYNTKTQRIEVDKRYLLVDGDQMNALKRCYEQVINPQLKIEKAADFISGASKDEVEIPEAVTA